MIHYDILMRALDYYHKDLDYEYIEVPWLVDPVIDAITKPKEASPCIFKNKTFVGSAEQSFLQLISEDFLSPNIDYVTITPCIRDEDNDETHHTSFMKVELFYYIVNLVDYAVDTQEVLNRFIEHAYSYFNKYANSQLEIIRTGDFSYDINNNGIEVGSYSIKNGELNGKTITWVCGTGIAEPRFSYSLSQHSTWKEYGITCTTNFDTWTKGLRCRKIERGEALPNQLDG